MATSGTDRAASLADVAFRDGGHMLHWISVLRDALVMWERLLRHAKADIKGGLSHQKWRLLHGELPPRVRAIKTTASLGLACRCIDAAIGGLNTFEFALRKRFIDPALSATTKKDAA